MPDMGKTLCPSDAGIIAGVLDKTLRKNHSVKEVKCWGTGHDFCEFEINEL
jgi:predicted hydrocarbon binding protein